MTVGSDWDALRARLVVGLGELDQARVARVGHLGELPHPGHRARDEPSLVYQPGRFMR